MKTTLLSSFLILATGLSGFCTTWTVTNSKAVFTPSTLTIDIGDQINFDLGEFHDVLEVSATTWNANGTTPLAGGFSTPFGGGLVTASELEEGTHYFVCEN